MLLAATGSKLLPVRVTVVPTGPEVGEKELMAGTCAITAQKATRRLKRRRIFFIAKRLTSENKVSSASGTRRPHPSALALQRRHWTEDFCSLQGIQMVGSDRITAIAS